MTQLMTDYIPSKLSTARFSQPWINRDLKRLSHRKKRAYKKAKISRKNSDWERYKQLKKESQKECRKAYSAHVNELVSDDQTGNPKKLYSFIKSKNVMPAVLPHCSPMESITVIASRSQIYSTTSSLLFSLLKILQPSRR